MILTRVAFGVQRLGIVIAIALMAAGYLTWTLMEYWVHRAVFHLQPRGPRSASFVWAIHGVHHDHPNDPRQVVTSPVVSVPIGAIAAVLFWLALPGAMWLPFAASWVAGISPMTCSTRICTWAGPGRRSSAGCGRGTCITTSRTPEHNSA